VKEDFEAQAYYATDASGVEVKRQSGVMRINCIDCLDRTNVVQGVFARKVDDLLWTCHAGACKEWVKLPSMLIAA
jgi:hypothetical protein